MRYQYINLAYLGRMAGEEPETRRQLLFMLMEELETALPAIRAFLEQEDWPALLGASHHLKSTLAFAGNAGMDEANRCIERHLKEEPAPSPSFIAFHVEALEALLPFVLEELRQEGQKG